MLAKLKSHGIGGRVFEWISDWTRSRTQRVVLNGEQSDIIDVTSSVVQGSVLGPILFIIFINDLDVAIDLANDVHISKFADDTKLSKKIMDINDCHKLQKALDELTLWSEKWGMELHPDKCCVLHFGHNNPRNTYTINGKALSPTTRPWGDSMRKC